MQKIHIQREKLRPNKTESSSSANRFEILWSKKYQVSDFFKWNNRKVNSFCIYFDTFDGITCILVILIFFFFSAAGVQSGVRPFDSLIRMIANKKQKNKSIQTTSNVWLKPCSITNSNVRTAHYIIICDVIFFTVDRLQLMKSYS